MSGGGQCQIAYTDTIGTGANQLYVSSNYGSTWTAKESPRVWSDIKLSFDGQIQIALQNDQTSGRIYISYDFGATWEAKGPDVNLGAIFNWLYAALSLNGQYIVAATSERVFFSFNSGETWTESSNKPWFTFGYGAFSGLSVSSNGQNQVILASNDVVTSNDYGANWSTSKLFRRNASQPVISSSGQIQMLFGKETQFQTFPQINVSVDYGATWAKKESITTRDWRKLAISADGTRAAGIVGGNQVFVSSNTGNFWTSKLAAPLGTGLFLLEMSSSGKNIIAGSISQLYVSTDFGETWALKYSAASQVITDVKISQDGTHGSATLTTEKIYTTQRTRLI
jgi:photosystem II stability/assembly factor-like uncharacterized protein